MLVRFNGEIVGDREAIVTIEFLIGALVEVLQDPCLMDTFSRFKLISQYSTALSTLGLQLTPRQKKVRRSKKEYVELWNEFSQLLVTFFDSVIVAQCPTPSELVYQAVRGASWPPSSVL